MTAPGVKETRGHLWVEEGEPRDGAVADVAPVVHSGRTFTYTVPDSLAGRVTPGRRVMIPFGRSGRLVKGYVVSLDRRTWDSTLRPIHSLVDQASFLTPDLIELGKEIALHYACPLGRTLHAITPEDVRKQRGFKPVRYARLVASPDEINDGTVRITTKRRAILDVLGRSTEPVRVDRLLERCAATAAVLGSLVKLGWIDVETRRELVETDAPARSPEDAPFELNVDQRRALETINASIDAGGFGVTLLYGVSGSGKTEVYIRAIQKVTAAGRQAILLIPEIVLTTQLVGRLELRLGDLAVSHSGLTGARRSLMWQQIVSGQKKVVVGTRSAVFAPCPNLGLICVDEEQETSYKNLQAPRFHVRDVAIMRAKQLGLPVLLGSATPSVETWYHSHHRADYQRITLPKRVMDLPLPSVHLVDMQQELLEQKHRSVLSRSMDRLLSEALDRGEQALLLVNRRGFATRILCPACRVPVTCPNCNVALVVHRAAGRSICHYCRVRIETPTVCATLGCGGTLVQLGTGTQRVEDVLAMRFPKARIQRVDSDAMKHRDQTRRLVDDFEARKIDILVGTQMIAKGLDFPFVSFVGVIHADPASLAADFRAQERLFQLITQVAGRAGRANTAGRVVVQTTSPDLPALRFALQHDYESFVAEELRIRRRVGLPPFRRLVRLVVAHAREETARQQAEDLAERIRGEIDLVSPPLEQAEIQGPNPCALTRLRGKYRYDLLISTTNASAMRRLMRHLHAVPSFRSAARNAVIDVDPVALS